MNDRCLGRRGPARALVALSYVAALVALAPATAAAAERLTLRDVFELEYAGDPRVGPRGERIVYQRRSMDIMHDRRRSSLWLIEIASGEQHALTTGNVSHSAPRWSPSGDRIAYVAGSGDDGRELQVRWLESDREATLTQLPQSPSAPTWSPDGRHLAFSMQVPTEAKPFVSLPSKPEGAEWADPPKVIDKLIYRRDGGGYVEDGYRQLFVVPADGGTPRQLTKGAFHHGGPLAWTPDGSALIFSANRHDDWRRDPLNSEIYRLDIASGDVRALTERQGPDYSPALSPDGERIAYLGFDDRRQGYQTTRLYVMDADGSGARALTEALDRSVRAPSWGADGERIYFQYVDRGETKVAYVDLDGNITDVAGSVGGTSLGRPYSSGTYTQAKGRVAFTHATPQRPADVAVAGPDAGTKVLTRLNRDLLGHRELGEVERIEYASSHDDRQIEGWIVKPPQFDPDKRYPLVLEIHGGPFASYGPYFASEIQLYAAAGYVVLYTNPRGSTSYGQAFGNLIHHAYPGHDYDDLISGVDAVLERGYVDPERLYVTGGSGGGVLSAWTVGKTDRFRAAVVAKPVINWYSFALTADNYNFYYKYWFPGLPWEHRDHYMDRSPISLVGEVETPTMLLTGERDYRTPISESEQFYQALKLAEVETKMVRIPGASHHIAQRPSQLIAKAAHVLKWFETHGGESLPRASAHD